MRLNLGCSDSFRGGEWVNVDIAAPEGYDALGSTTGRLDSREGPKFWIADLALPWPWADSSVDEIYAADIFEHIGDCDHLRTLCERCIEAQRRYLKGHAFDAEQGYIRHWSGRIHVMCESWRVLKPGGILTMECPDAAKGAGHFQDPTHVTPWTPNGLQYFADGSPAHKRFAEAYGITARFNVRAVTERKYEETAGLYVGCPPPAATVRCEVWKFTALMEAVK